MCRFENEIFVLEFCGFPCFSDVGKGRRLPLMLLTVIIAGEI